MVCLGRQGILASAAVLILAASVPAQVRENAQVLVLGFTLLGNHSFSESDEVRKANSDPPESSAGMGHAYVEWYALDRFGIGVRWLFLRSGDTLLTPSHRDKQLSLQATLRTFHFVPYISPQGYYRLGFLAGAGKARYTQSNFTQGVYDPELYTASGSATLAQVYWDWGGDLLGARLGMGYLATDLDKLKVDGESRQADATGTHIFLDLRWAFP